MVKGTSRQVIMVHSPETQMFEQAIFILKENAVGDGISDDALLKEAQRALHGPVKQDKHRFFYFFGAMCAGIGALIMGMIWLATVTIL